MFAFLRSNTYPKSTTQNPELRGRRNDIRFGLVSSSVKMRANINANKPPLHEIALDPVVLSEILFRELVFCQHTITFLRNVAFNYAAATTAADTETESSASASEQAHSARISNDVVQNYHSLISLCRSIGIDHPTMIAMAATSDAAYEKVCAKMSTIDCSVMSEYFVSICEISRTSWNIMTVMAFANLYRYHATQATQSTHATQINPDDAIFAVYPKFTTS